MRVIFAVWECAPFIKVGGLGDVARSLPKSLKRLGVDIRLVLPFYKAIKSGRQKRLFVSDLFLNYANARIKIKVYQIHFPDIDIPVYLLKNKKYFDRPGAETWPVFDMAVALVSRDGIQNWHPQIIHCNDNHCGLIPLLVKVWQVPVKTLFSIHSMLYQRRLPEKIAQKMGVPLSKFSIMKWEIKSRRIVAMLEGIIHADVVNTVSPTYAKEILTEEYGVGLDDTLVGYSNKIVGILNGIDDELRDPQNRNLVHGYDHSTVSEGKAANKKSFQKNTACL